MLEKILGQLRFRTVNDDERPGDQGRASGSKLRRGRAWLYLDEGFARSISASWSFRKRDSGLMACLDVDAIADSDVGVSFGTPVSFVSLSANGVPQRFFRALGLTWEQVKAHPDGSMMGQREIRISAHGGTLYWRFWQPVHLMKSSTPKWREGSFTPADTFLGRAEITRERIDRVAILVPMPERSYRWSVDFERVTVKRPRWPSVQTFLTFNAKALAGEQIPKPGKGENAWDCGEDAIFSMSAPCDRALPEIAVARVVESVLCDRRRHGGPTWKPEAKSPATPA